MIAGTRVALTLLLLLLAARSVAAQPCADCLQAGAARVELRVPAGTPLAGYGSLARRLLVPDVLGRHPHAFWFKPAEGARDPLAARALVLAGPGRRLAWVSVDLLAVDHAFVTDVEERLGADGGPTPTLLLSATHTHSGPGAYVRSAALGWLALDSLDTGVREGLIESVVSAVRAADAARRPARLAAASVAVPTMVTSRLGRPLDAEMLIVKVTDTSGRAIALVWNYAIHGTALGPRNLRLSGDIMGEASRRLEALVGAPALFVNGAVGDVSPLRHGERAVVEIGGELALAAQGGWRTAEPVPGAVLAIGRRTVSLPAPSLSAHNCLRGWLPRAAGLPLGSVFPRETTLTALAVGDVGVVTIPGELQTSLGRHIKDTAAGADLRRVLVAGLSNDYLGYFTTVTDYDRPGYVSCASLYGAPAGECLAGAAAGLLGSVARGHSPVSDRAACDR